MSEKIFVTGAAGFIGFQVVKELLEQGNSVVGLDNMSDCYDSKLKEYRLNLINNRDNFQFCRGGIENLALLQKIFQEN